MLNYVFVNRGNFHLKLLRRFRDIAVFVVVSYFAAPCRLPGGMFSTGSLSVRALPIFRISAVKQSTYLSGWRSDDIHLVARRKFSSRSPRSSSGRKCSVARVHSRFGDRWLAAAGPRIWNNLTCQFARQASQLHRIRIHLKTFTFQTDCGARDFFDYYV